MSENESVQLGQLSKPAIISELLDCRRRLAEVEAAAMATGLVASTRLDCLRMVAMQMNRDPAPPASMIVPEGEAERRLLAKELRSLAEHIREQADGFTQSACIIDPDSSVRPVIKQPLTGKRELSE